MGYECYKEPIEIECLVMGKALSPYVVPAKFKIHCNKNTKQCGDCRFYKNDEAIINFDDNRFLYFVDVSSDKFNRIIKFLYSLTCKNINVEVLEYTCVEKIFITNLIDKSNKDFKKINNIYPIAYYVGTGIETNMPYRMEGFITNNPYDQTLVNIFLKAEKIKLSIDLFKLNKDIYSSLCEFNVKKNNVEEIYDFLEKLYDVYAHNITNIYNRFDLHLAVDLVFKSVLSFYLNKEYIHKGWIDAMVIGDTRCGKGYVSERLVNYFGVGEVISADYLSLAGLIGGLQQFGGKWVLTWGKIPLNDRGLVVIDEANELSEDVWAKLSRIRSEGIAEITKIISQVSSARTRLIFLANPLGKVISNYSYGIQSIIDIVKNPEDIARFDYILVVSHDEVSPDEINKPRNNLPDMFTREQERNLILWIWSRKPDDIVFSDKAIKYIYDLSIKLSNIYSFSLPLIQGENVRTKLAKIAIAFAGRVFSNLDKGKKLFVDTVHVECAYYFLNLIYKKECAGYYMLSKIKKPSESPLNDSVKNELEKYFKAWGLKRNMILKCLLILNTLTINDIAEYCNISIEIAKEVIYKLLSLNCIIKKGNFYVKTQSFIIWLRNNYENNII